MAKYWVGIRAEVKFQLDLPQWGVSITHDSLIQGAGKDGGTLQINGNVSEIPYEGIRAIREWVKARSVKFRPDGMSLLVDRDPDLARLDQFVWLRPYSPTEHSSMARGSAVPPCLSDEVTA